MPYPPHPPQPTLGKDTPSKAALEIDAARPEPKPIKQFFAGLAIYLVANLGSVLGMTLTTAAVHGLDATEPMGGIFSEPWPGLPVGLGIQAILSVIGYRFVIKRLAGRPVYELAGPGAWREFGLGLALGALPIVLSATILWAMGVYTITDISLNTGIVIGLMLGIGAAFAEEIFFRGIVLRLLDKRFGSWVALGTVSVIFGLIHLTNPGATLWGAIAIVLSAGLLLNAAYLLTRRLWLPIGIHLSWNAVQGGIFGIDVSGSGSGRGLFESTLTGPELLSGGSMGIEGSIVLVVIATIIGIGLTIIAAKRGQMRPPRRRLKNSETLGSQPVVDPEH